MNIPHDEKTKKRVIAGLLFISCITSAIILGYTSAPTGGNALRNFEQADSLITNTLARFNIGSDQIRMTTTQKDSGFIRKSYYVDTPPGFSKTLLHAELNRIFHSLTVDTPARIMLPENTMKIHLLYRDTVFRTITLRTDLDLVLERNYASIIIAFDEAPSTGLINEIIRFGEPITVVLRVPDGDRAIELRSQVIDRYSNIAFWFERSEGSGTEPGVSSFPPLSHLQELPSKSSFLSFKNLDSNRSGSKIPGPLIETAAEKDLSVIDVSNAMILDSQLGKSVFNQELAKFEQRARNHQHPIAIIMADEKALNWLREKLNQFKKGGLYLTPPPDIDY